MAVKWAGRSSLRCCLAASPPAPATGTTGTHDEAAGLRVFANSLPRPRSRTVCSPRFQVTPRRATSHPAVTHPETTATILPPSWASQLRILKSTTHSLAARYLRLAWKRQSPGPGTNGLSMREDAADRDRLKAEATGRQDCRRRPPDSVPEEFMVCRTSTIAASLWPIEMTARIGAVAGISSLASITH